MNGKQFWCLKLSKTSIWTVKISASSRSRSKGACLTCDGGSQGEHSNSKCAELSRRAWEEWARTRVRPWECKISIEACRTASLFSYRQRNNVEELSLWWDCPRALLIKVSAVGDKAGKSTSWRWRLYWCRSLSDSLRLKFVWLLRLTHPVMHRNYLLL